MESRNCQRNRIVRSIWGALVLVIVSACGGGGGGGSGSGAGNTGGGAPAPGFIYQPPADISDGWTVAEADTQGISSAALEAMMDTINNGRFPVIDSIAIARRGRLVFDETLRTELSDFDRDVGNDQLGKHAQFSVSKSVTSIAVGVAIDQGIIAGVDVPYLSLFPYENYENWDDRKNDVTLDHVLSMRLGLDWNEWQPGYNDPDNMLIRFYEDQFDYSKGLLDLPMIDDPGSAFAYNTIATVSLGQAIENSGPLSLIDFSTTHLLGPLGITDVSFYVTPTGLPNGGSGLFFFTRDMLKFGQLYLDEGQWNSQQIVSSDWVAASLVPRTEFTWSNPGNWDWQVSGYGYQWWTGTFDYQGRQVQSFAARGFGFQVLMVIPELELVVAVNSNGYEETDDQANQVFDLIANFVLPALE